MVKFLHHMCRRGLHCCRAILQLRETHTIPLTNEVYPIKRGQYAAVTDSHIQQFEAILGPQRVITESSEVAPHNVDWFKTVQGRSSVVLKPRTTEEVSAIMRVCYDSNLAVCPQGGNTGVVGGSIPIFDEIILSTSLMNKVLKINELPGSIVCQAGCVLEALNATLDDHGLMMPLDLGAKGSCHIGGNIATNAGGIRLLRYGNLHANTLGLIAVKADGEVLDCMNTLRKDKTGYHLKHLFIGSEGTLGIVTEVAILCPPKPQSIAVAFLGVQDFEQVIKTYRLANRLLAEVLSACEVIDAESLRPVNDLFGLTNPLPGYNFYLLLETSGSHCGHDEEKLQNFLKDAMGSDIVNDGLFTSEPSKIKKLWELRERIPEALATGYYAFLYDFTLPLNAFYQLVPELRVILKDTAALAVTGFGHFGDGNLHLNICCPEFSEEVMTQIETFVFKWVGERGGSVSAEHGIGIKKTKFLHFSKSDAAIHNMRQIKKLMDPRGILNPYKVLPS